VALGVLWDEVERLFDAWCALGAPNRDRFRLTVQGTP
jgi:hypothetical protein